MVGCELDFILFNDENETSDFTKYGEFLDDMRINVLRRFSSWRCL